MGKQNHIIRKLIIEIGLPTREEVSNIQNRLTDEYKRIILDIIEEILDRLIDKDEVIRVDKLEIDLGNISQMHMSEEISCKVKQEMEGTLTKLMHEVTEAEGNEAEIRMTTSNGASFTVNATKQQSSRSDFETLIYFLEYGIFPWNNERKEKPSLKQMMALAMEKNPDPLRQVLHRAHSKKHIFRRLALQLTEAQLHYLAAILGCSFSSQLSELSTQLQKQIRIFLETNKDKLGGKIAFTANELVQRLPEETLLYFASGTNRASSSSSELNDPVVNYIFRMLEELFLDTRILTKTVSLNPEPGKRSSKTKTKSRIENTATGKVVSQIHIAFDYFVEKRKERLTEINSTSNLQEQRFSENSSETTLKKQKFSENSPGPISKEQKPSENNSEPISKKQKPSKRTSRAISKKQQASESNSEALSKKEQPSAESNPETKQFRESEIIPENKYVAKKDSIQPMMPEAEEGIYIDNAGLIILHPYLPAFFKNLGLVEEKDFVNDEAKYKAIHMLQWLTYGDERNSEYVEHELVLNKLLCDVPVSEPVPVSMLLSEKEKEDAMILLNAVITNWPIMKNSSVHALRTTFLQKEGRLMFGDNNWDLLIERDSAVEVLIDRLPWSISMIKLPWNDYTIYSTW